MRGSSLLLGAVALSLACAPPATEALDGGRPSALHDAGTDAGAGAPLDDGGSDAGDASSRDDARVAVILFVGDGMGAEAIRAARMFAHGNGDVRLAFEHLPVVGTVRTENAEGGVTDSAAAATAMATGEKVSNGVVSVRLPGDGAPLTTALEIANAAGLATGLVTTATAITDATPAAFGAHEPSRERHAEIAADYLDETRPDVLLGYAGPAMTRALAEAAGYRVAESEEELLGLEAEAAPPVAGLFTAETAPSLSTSTRFALDLLEEDPEGLFLVVEHEGPDNGGHANDLDEVVRAVLELEEAFLEAEAWAEGRPEVLLIVTSDHETGGLEVLETDPAPGALPDHAFSTGEHTGVPVPLFAAGPGADLLAGEIDNTRIFDALTARLSQ